MLKVTIDTDIVVGHKFGRFDCLDLASRRSLDIAVVTVTERELKCDVTDIIQFQRINETTVLGESNWDESDWSGPILEVAVMGESVIGKAVLGGLAHVGALEAILNILSSGGFPKVGQRKNLTDGQRHQLRDAMILEAHVRKKRDIFISNDKRAFIGKVTDDKRKQLESLFATRIMTITEFLAYLGEP